MATTDEKLRPEETKPSYGGTVGDSERYRTDDGRLHDEAPDGRGYERRAGEPNYPPGVENQFEIDRGAAQSTVARYGDELGLNQTGVINLDAKLRDLVLDRLSNLPQLAGKKIDVAVDSGIVSLTGEVGTPSLRNDIEVEVSHLSGVREVRNTIRIMPPALTTKE